MLSVLPRTDHGSQQSLGSYGVQGSVPRALRGMEVDRKWTLPQSFTTYEGYSPYDLRGT